MPFELRNFPKGHDGMEFPHFMLWNIHKKKYYNKTFKTRDAAINMAKAAIKFRERKESKVVKKNGKTFILPVN